MRNEVVLNEQKVLGRDFVIYGTVEEPLFVASDIAELIQHSNVTEMLKNVDNDEKLTSTIFRSGQSRQVNMLTENGLYEVLMLSRKPIAKQFKSEIKKILKSIRKNGGYIANQEQMTPEQIVANALIVAQNIISQKDRKIEELETSVQQMDSVISEMTPKVDYADRILSSTDCMTVSQIAQDYGVSAKRFNKILHSAGIQRKVGDQWILYAEYQGKGYVRNKTCEYTKSNGETGTKLLTVWTQKGRMLIYEKLKQIGVFPEMENAS